MVSLEGSGAQVEAAEGRTISGSVVPLKKWNGSDPEEEADNSSRKEKTLEDDDLLLLQFEEDLEGGEGLGEEQTREFRSTEVEQRSYYNPLTHRHNKEELQTNLCKWIIEILAPTTRFNGHGG